MSAVRCSASRRRYTRKNLIPPITSIPVPSRCGALARTPLRAAPPTTGVVRDIGLHRYFIFLTPERVLRVNVRSDSCPPDYPPHFVVSHGCGETQTMMTCISHWHRVPASNIENLARLNAELVFRVTLMRRQGQNRCVSDLMLIRYLLIIAVARSVPGIMSGAISGVSI